MGKSVTFLLHLRTVIMRKRSKVFKQLRNTRYAILSARRAKKSKMLELLRSHLNSITKEEFQAEIREIVGDKNIVPKGWVSIEEHLPMMYAKDIMQGYTEYKVKFENNKTGKTFVSDHNTWYYRAKDEGITHWFNK